jgi:hypothetical protein
LPRREQPKKGSEPFIQGANFLLGQLTKNAVDSPLINRAQVVD